jgi:hypothetical protein
MALAFSFRELGKESQARLSIAALDDSGQSLMAHVVPIVRLAVYRYVS